MQIPLTVDTDAAKPSLPTWARHSPRALEDVKEIGKALNHPYPYFLAPLTPERTFLHYLISNIICNVRLRDRADLQDKVEALYHAHVAEVTQDYEKHKEALADHLDLSTRLAKKYFDDRANNLLSLHKKGADLKPGAGAPKKTLLQILADRIKQLYHELIARNTDHILSSNEQEDKELKESFGVIYDHIYNNMADSIKPYKPGKTPLTNLRCFEDIFIAICQDELQREGVDQLVKAKARKLVEDAIKDGRFEALPNLTADKSKIIAITGIIASGKNRLLAALRSGNQDFQKMLGITHPLDRSDYAVIDVDEFRDLDRLLGSTGEREKNPHWGSIVHDECHMIRRKILDELNAQEKNGIYRNVVLMTSHLSTRIHKWMTRDNRHVDLYCLYCDKDKAVENAQLRAKRDGGYHLPDHIIPNSFRDLATTLGFIFGVETMPKINMTMRLIDTSAVNTEDKTLDAGQAMLNARTIMTADESTGVQVYNPELLSKVYAGEYLPVAPGIMRDMYAYPEIAADALNSLQASLWPHWVTFHSQAQPAITSVKDRRQDQLHGNVKALYAECPSLKAIYDEPPPLQGKSPYGTHTSRVIALRKNTGLGVLG